MQYKVAGYKDTYTYKSKTDIDRFFFLFFLFLSIRRAVPKTKISHKDAHDPVAPRNWVILRPQQKMSFRFLPKKLLFACLSRNFLDNDPSFSPSFSSFSFDRFGIRNTRRGKKEETHVGRSFKNGGSTFVSIPFLLFPPEYNQRLCFRFLFLSLHRFINRIEMSRVSHRKTIHAGRFSNENRARVCVDRNGSRVACLT